MVMADKGKKLIISSGWFCSKRCPFWSPQGFREICTAYGNAKLEFNHKKDANKRCGPCLADYPITAEAVKYSTGQCPSTEKPVTQTQAAGF
jgi:hypothetical protein